MADERDDELVVVTRDIELDLPVEQLWELVADGTRWADWLASAAEVDVVDGGGGTLVDDDGATRRVRINRVEPAAAERRVGFTWWPEGEAGSASTVELVVAAAPAGSRLRVREVWAMADPARTVTSLRAWDIRALVLWSVAGSLAGSVSGV